MQRLAAEVLKEKNLKATPQRIAIYNILRDSTSHPSAETIYQKLDPTHSTMSLATVYKTIEALNGAGLIQTINVCEDKFRYDANTEIHSHMICTKCKSVYDAPYVDIEELQKNVSNDFFEVKYSQLYFYGICENCKDV